MKNADMHEKWMEKCDVAKKAQDKYNKGKRPPITPCQI